MADPGRPAAGPWYAKGVRFRCTGCARCCHNRGEYEAVWVSRGEISALADHLGLSVRELRARFLVRIDGEWSLGSRGDACVLLDDASRCSVYPVRPRQCRTWPFWSQNLDEDVWSEEVLPLCPGVGRGRLYRLEEIRALAGAAEGRRPVPDLPLSGDGGGRRPPRRRQSAARRRERGEDDSPRRPRERILR